MNNRAMLGSVVIPAHNEATVINRCLDSLMADFSPSEVDVVIACNGCTDGTADVVRASGHTVRVVEIDTPSKAAALRAAERATNIFPRLYLDADVVLPSQSARHVLDYLRSDGALAARPPLKYNTGSSERVVRSYYRARESVPAVMSSLWGAGVYGLSEAGRARFGDFPDLMGDDLFVDQHFRRSEIVVIHAAPVVVNAPHQTADLLRILRRIYKGNSENHMLTVHPSEEGDTTQSTVLDLVRLSLTRPTRILDVITYLMLAILARASLAVDSPNSWERDNSSRMAVVPKERSAVSQDGRLS